ncbi:MAG: hypothetical protein R3217_09055 [Gammaproteobacteria bacterium]|nr:hypothetical protein [Gammaproteobacteria bacterium]
MASLSLFLVGGCSLFAEWESGRVETVARSEDRACRQRDYQWPSEAYIECRLQLYNHRNRENWERLSLSQNSPGEISAAANRSGERYKPARRDNFDCEMRPSSAGDIDYVHCAETDTARPDINP